MVCGYPGIWAFGQGLAVPCGRNSLRMTGVLLKCFWSGLKHGETVNLLVGKAWCYGGCLRVMLVML